MKGIIFDMDGTLIDSMGYWYETGQVISRPYINREDPKVLDRIKDMSAKELTYYIAGKLDESTRKKFMDDWLDLMHQYYLTKVQVKPYVFEYLDKCLKEGIKMVVATATDKVVAVDAIKHLGLEKYFIYIIDEDEVGVGKSKPDIYLKAAQIMDIAVSDCAVFEDNPRFAKTAKDAGFITIGVYDELARMYEEKMKEFCDKYIHSYKELI